MQRFDQLFFDRSLESWEGINADEFIGFIRPKCQEILTVEELKKTLEEKEKLRVKLGIDPTGSDIHLGHVVPILLLNQFVKAGHQVDFIIGDFTARIGDPSGRETSRKTLSTEEILENTKTYKDQIAKYINVDKIHIHYNSQWLNSVSLPDIFSIFQQINLAEATQRNDFRKRMENNQGVSLAEVCYGVLMGLDSVNLNSDIELGGIDQLLNFQQCRKIMEMHGMKEEVILMTPILEGTTGDGRKMSKSFNNYIAVNASLEDKFGKIMSIPDNLIFQYFRSFADVHEREIEFLQQFITDHPLEAKKQLGAFLVALETKNLADGLQEREHFERKYSKREIIEEDCINLQTAAGETFFNVLFESRQFKSKSELRRMFNQQGVRIVSEPEQILKLEDAIKESCMVRVGKHKYFKVTI
ncbi:tyrosine--tRNA ligase [Paenactinomyces guangxiensis]|uniref:Tyrosine--tRNA ligase n=1 Tax=Paenactinomyces guangxiensis TaxID=1490290 RepID=A0A7W1WUR5_9BACL|nr:tyrosine--tRNA ligase [Paenactinomyces guangxiensis]MBA4496434.1 tyrosine--tRNA ligase [Paenactinomyces guangxiensis]MBH8593535.1 tyrosine--tRNA ligase [Paenactinomyces guangxiensis]